MDLGEKIVLLRKEKKLSQEQLAELVGVTRQTISKWELGETSPNISEAKELSKIFGVSLDELVGNDIKDIITEKVSNTEKLAGIIIKILKVMGGLLILYILMIVSALILFSGVRHEEKSTVTTTLDCEMQDEEYMFNIEYDGATGKTIKVDGDRLVIDKIDLNVERDAGKVIDKINAYFLNHGGRC